MSNKYNDEDLKQIVKILTTSMDEVINYIINISIDRNNENKFINDCEECDCPICQTLKSIHLEEDEEDEEVEEDELDEDVLADILMDNLKNIEDFLNETDEDNKQCDTKKKEKKEKKVLIDSPVRVEKKKHEDNLLVPASKLKKMTENKVDMNAIKKEIIKMVSDKLVTYASLYKGKNDKPYEVNILFVPDFFNVLEGISKDNIRELVDFIKSMLTKNGYIVKETEPFSLNIKW